MKILYIGDIVGKMGLEYLKQELPKLKTEYKPNLIFVNAENTTYGKGLSLKDYKEIMKLNISGITMGNHTFRNAEINDYIDEAKIARPININKVKGKGYIDINYNDKIITVINAIGLINLTMNEEVLNPFKVIEEFIENHRYNHLIVDFHAEATSEKLAMGYFLDGVADIVLGTHTHIQTNDAKVLPKGTLYLTDLGMTGPLNGVIGVDPNIIIDRLKDDGKQVFKLHDDGHVQLNGALFDLTNKKIKLIHLEK